MKNTKIKLTIRQEFVKTCTIEIDYPDKPIPFVNIPDWLYDNEHFFRAQIQQTMKGADLLLNDESIRYDVIEQVVKEEIVYGGTL